MDQNNEMKKIYLKDYVKPNFEILSVHLDFSIFNDFTRVVNTMKLKQIEKGDLELNGELLKLISISINQNKISSDNYNLNEEKLVFNDQNLKNILGVKSGSMDSSISGVEFELQIETEIYPHLNTALEGLYKTGTGLCTQCEPEGFRKITYFIDRPDVMTVFKCSITADKIKFPILLSNGNLVQQKDLSDGRHLVVWEDPFKKPCYLFALVAGDYGCIRDEFTTHTNRKILLELYSPHGTQDRARFALEALKKSMRWDEEHYGREYDLDRYMILSVDDFNAGAMENKGLNIFNSKFIMASPESATDDDYEDIDAVVAHEYFHNWTGNRITLRDWFHLSLKEGLTVFRDQQYTEHQTSSAVKRIDDVERLRNAQFAEDAGPNSHPVRPESCYSVDNFFSTTIYEKGAEVIRVLSNLLGHEKFRSGMDFYFEKFDGQAVTIEDFVSSFEATSKVDLSHFRKWYSQSGTPEVKVEESFDNLNKIYKLKLIQINKPTEKQKEKGPLLIPIRGAFYYQTGQKVELSSIKVIEIGQKNKKTSFLNFNLKSNHEAIICLQDNELELEFHGFESKPIPSLLRHFSAPVNLTSAESIEDLILLSKYDDDGFNRWEALQKIALKLIIQNYNAIDELNFDFSPIKKVFQVVFEQIISSIENDDIKTKNSFSYYSKLISFPNIKYVIQFINNVDPVRLADVIGELQKYTVKEFKNEILKIYRLLPDVSDLKYASISIRKLKQTLLGLMGFDPELAPMIFDTFMAAEGMTLKWGALEGLNSYDSKFRSEAGQIFKDKWSTDTLVINKYFIWEASFSEFVHFETYINKLNQIMSEPIFSKTNPNNVRSILGGLASFNYKAFHYLTEDGQAPGYEWFADQLLEVDKLNPQTAARLASFFDIYPRLDSLRKSKMENILNKILETPNLSKNTFEIIKNTKNCH